MRGSRLGVITAAILPLVASSAHAGITVGQLDPGGSPTHCGSDFDFLQPTVTSGNSYVMPYDGTITSWSTRANATAGLQMTLKIFRGTGGATYQVVGHAGPQTLQPGGVNSFPANVAIKAGDVLGVGIPAPTGPACLFPVTNETYLYRYGFPVPGGLGDGGSGTFQSGTDSRVNVSAVLEPTNTFSFGGVTRSRKKGTATLTLTVPNPGEVTVAGKGVSGSGAQAVASMAVPTAGSVSVVVRANGKRLRTLKETGKVKVKTIVTYTPTGGSPSQQSLKLKLLKH